MADTPEHLPEETTEKGFGTGLRAQLQRRQTEGDSPTPEAQGQPNVELRFELTARPSGEGEPLAVSADVSALKSELDAARRREEALRLRLEKQTEAYSDGMSSEQELATRDRAADARLQGRERALEKRDNELRAQDKEMAERERRLATRENDLKKEAARIAAKDEAIGEREGDILLRQEKLRNDAERFERELSDKGRVAEEAVARSAQLDQRELDLTAREAELNRLQASLAHAERDANRGRDLEERAARLDERERALAERESELTTYESTTDSEAARRPAREAPLLDGGDDPRPAERAGRAGVGARAPRGRLR